MEENRKVLYVVSSLARIFPPKSGPEYAALKDSVRSVGLLEPLLLWRRTVVDGFHRLRACLELGVQPEFDALPAEADPMEIVANRVGHQRHLNETARAAAAVMAMGKPSPGRPKGSGKNRANLRGFRTRKWASESFRVSERTITTVARILDPESGAIPAVRSALRQGLIPANDGRKALNETPEVQRDAMELINNGRANRLGRAFAIIKNEAEQRNSGMVEDPVRVATGRRVVLHDSTVAGLNEFVAKGSVDAIVTFPPAGERDLNLIADLAGFAAHSLRNTGAIFVLAGTDNLPALIDNLRHDELRWICAYHYTHPSGTHGRGDHHKRPRTHKLVLVIGKPGYRLDAGDDAIVVPAIHDGTGKGRFDPRLEIGFEMIIERFTQPHHIVADPIMAARVHSALAAVKLGRSFIGAWKDRTFIDRLRARFDVATGCE